MATARVDSELFETLKTRLRTAALGDVLDGMGLRHQFLPQGIHSLKSDMVVAGRAMPVLEADVFSDRDPSSSGPFADKEFGLMLEALDDLAADEVYMATGGSLRYALWGELMSTRAGHLKAAGAVLDGYVRDSAGIEKLGFPTFSRGLYAQDQGPRGKVINFRCTVEIGGVHVTPGALVFGDREGVIVMPPEAEDEAVRRALEKTEAENTVERAIRSGMSATEAFRTYGVM